MNYVLAQHCKAGRWSTMATLTDKEGRPVVFNSKKEAENFVKKIGRSLEDILVIPEMEVL